jgi:hypothetical protein
MVVTPSKLRQNIYKLLERIVQTGIPLEIKCKGNHLKIIIDEKMGKLKNLRKRKGLNCDPEEIVHMDWSTEWTG